MKSTKLTLSPYYWANFWFFLVLTIAVEAGLVWMYLNWELSAEDLLWIPVVFMPAMVLVFLLTALHPWRFLMTMEVCDSVFRSFLFGKRCCEVTTDRPVYYARIEFDEHRSIDKPYIAVSNHPFRVKPRSTALIPLRSDRFIDYYDRKAIILFPYNAQTEGMFPLERWHRVN